MLSMDISVPGQEKGRMDLHSVSESAMNLTLCSCL